MNGAPIARANLEPSHDGPFPTEGIVLARAGAPRTFTSDARDGRVQSKTSSHWRAIPFGSSPSAPRSIEQDPFCAQLLAWETVELMRRARPLC